MALHGHEAFVGAPRYSQFTGGVMTFIRNDSTGEWREGTSLVPFDAAGNSQFGSAIGFAGNDVWIGAPGADRFQGRVYLFRRAADSTWSAATKLGSSGARSG